MTIKIYFPLSAVSIFCAVCIGNIEMLKKNKEENAFCLGPIFPNKTRTLCIHMQLCMCLALTSAHVPCVWSCVTSLLRIVLMTSPPCMLRNPEFQMIFQSINSNNDHAWQDYIAWNIWFDYFTVSEVTRDICSVIHLRWSDVFCCVLNAVSQHGHTSHLSVHRALWTRLGLLIRFLTDKYMPAKKTSQTYIHHLYTCTTWKTKHTFVCKRGNSV